MKRIYVVWLLVVSLCANGCAQREIDRNRQSTNTVSVPEFTENTRRFIAASGSETLQEYVWANNWQALNSIFKLDSELVRREMIRRVSDETYPWRLRNLAAAVLMVKNDDAGRNYFKRQLETFSTSNAEIYWLVGWYAVYGYRNTNDHPDMAWAEDLMINALQDKRTLSRDEICRCNYIEEQKLVEVREIATTIGRFPAILASMKSQRALPVILSLIKEDPPYANHIIGELGKFGDRDLEPMIIQILKRHDDHFSSAVSAAVDLKMSSIVPILLQHLNNEDDNVYYGLNELADASILPVLRRKLPALKSSEKANARLLILKLQREDPVPELLRLLRDPKFLARDDVIFRLEELKDNRATKDLTNVLCTDVSSPVRTFALRALAAIRTPDALEGLIKGLEADYTNVERLKVSPDHDFKKEFQKQIAQVLKEITGKDFGENANEWRKWLAANKDAL